MFRAVEVPDRGPSDAETAGEQAQALPQGREPLALARADRWE